MTATERQQRKRQLERAGFAYVAGWLPAHAAMRVIRQMERYESAVDEVIEKE